MDKNMIHIDDLVKLRLSGGEEQEMSGSWLRMRELLDKEMPEKKRVAGYYNWRRMYGVMTGLALLSVLTAILVVATSLAFSLLLLNFVEVRILYPPTVNTESNARPVITPYMRRQL